MVEYDVIIIGGGPAGERAAVQAARHGWRAVIVERYEVVGGTGVNWGAIPSKTLRESALWVHGMTQRRLDAIGFTLSGEISIADFMHREREVVRRQRELAERALQRYGVTVVTGHGRFVDPQTVEVVGADGSIVATLTAPAILIATGSSPNRPASIPFDAETIFDSTTVLRLPRMPQSMIVVGAGVIGIEYASIFAALGLQVTLVDTRTELLPYLDREIAGILKRELIEDLGIRFIGGTNCSDYRRIPGNPPSVACRTEGGEELAADVLLYCVGRDGNTAELGLDRAGLTTDARGLINVDKFYRTAVPHIYAVGDVIGYPALASTSMEQGRQAIRHAFRIPGPHARTEQLPFAIYSIPEVSYVGPSSDVLDDRGVEYVVGRGRYDHNPRGQIMGATGGVLKLLFDADSLRLIGAHVVGAAASEIIHVAQAFMACDADATQIAETLFNYPTLSDLYRHAALEALAARKSLRTS